MKSIFLVTLAFSLLIAIGVTAGEDLQKANQQTKQVEQPQLCLDKLNSVIDYWHDAYLNGDDKKIQEYEEKICDVIVDDINALYKLVSSTESAVSASSVEGENAANQDGKSEAARIRKILNAKELLLARLQTGESFGQKYRVLGDYQDLLRRQLGLTRLELAEDVEEFVGDGGDSTLR